MLTLYHSPLIPACRKIRLMLREKNLDHTLVTEDFWTRRIEFFTMNPAGEVPVLTTDKNTVIVGPYAICEYLDEQFPNIQFFGNMSGERAEVRRLVEWFDVKFEREVTQLVLFEKVFKRLLGYGEPSSEAIRAGKRNITYGEAGNFAKMGIFDYLDLLSAADLVASSMEHYLTRPV